eukprot:scaffold2071_cov56-Phaeocystis_antarctica.AAC.8
MIACTHAMDTLLCSATWVPGGRAVHVPAERAPSHSSSPCAVYTLRAPHTALDASMSIMRRYAPFCPRKLPSAMTTLPSNPLP